MIRDPIRRVALVFVSLLAIGVVGPGFAQSSTLQTDDDDSKSTAEQAGVTQDAATSASEMSEEDKIAAALANPLSYLWLLFMQQDFISYDGDVLDALGEDAQTQSTTLLMPVLSVQLTEKWKTIFRPVIPINSFKVPGNVNITGENPGQVIGVDLERESGLGDIVLWTAFSNKYEPPFVFGFGPTIMLNTASDDRLGTGKNSAGPMVLAVAIKPKWIIGFVGQHWWSFSGDDTLTIQTTNGPAVVDRPDLSLTDVQPIVRYRMSLKTNIGFAPNWRYNWKTDELNLPLGMGFDTLVKFGKLPVKVGVEAYHYFDSSDAFGPDWQVRILFVPVIPSPGWARKPLFGGK
jgi:hypothetical protein